jgi:GT2 family glycosyltransferase
MVDPGRLLPPTTAGLALLLALRADRLYRGMPQLPVARGAPGLPPLSVIVPARNEAGNLGRLLPALMENDYPGCYEVIVVDDGSTDRTAAVAAAHGARVIALEGPPAGWLGKPNACQQGADTATGEWLLFVDADTVHVRHSAASAVAYAASNDLDGLSLFPAQETGSWMEQLGLMVAYAGLFASLPNLDRILNGQFILLRRHVYEASGGHASVRQHKLEDLALGRRLHRLRYRVPVMRGDDAVRVRMYAGPGDAWSGLARLASNTLHWTGWATVPAVAFVTAAAAPLFTLVIALLRRRGRLAATAAWLVASVGFVPWARRFGGAGSAAVAPLGAALLQVAATLGLLRQIMGRGEPWKGRLV